MIFYDSCSFIQYKPHNYPLNNLMILRVLTSTVHVLTFFKKKFPFSIFNNTIQDPRFLNCVIHHSTAVDILNCSTDIHGLYLHFTNFFL